MRSTMMINEEAHDDDDDDDDDEDEDEDDDDDDEEEEEEEEDKEKSSLPNTQRPSSTTLLPCGDAGSGDSNKKRHVNDHIACIFNKYELTWYMCTQQ